jgi:hypothetical protein
MSSLRARHHYVCATSHIVRAGVTLLPGSLPRSLGLKEFIAAINIIIVVLQICSLI